MSRARLNKNSRRQGALERRKNDVTTYTAKLKESNGSNKPTAVEFYTDKLSKATTEVKLLEAKVIGR